MPDPDWNLTRRVWGVQNGRMDRLRDDDCGLQDIRTIINASIGMGIVGGIALVALIVWVLSLIISALS